jgi:hypothetical protein
MDIDLGLKREAKLLGERAGDPLRLDGTHIHQDFSQLLAGFLALARLFEILGRDPRTVEENGFETFSRGRHTSRWPESLFNYT